MFSESGRCANGGCKQCRKDRARAWAVEHPEEYNANRRLWANKNRDRLNEGRRRIRREQPEQEQNRKLKHRYGITLEQKNAQLVAQNHKCAACYKPFGETRRPETDHDHKTEQVRGQLCPSCNKALSHVKDDITVLLSLVEYLRKYQNKSAATTAL